MDIYDRIEAGEFSTKIWEPRGPRKLKPNLPVRHSAAEAKQYVKDLEDYETDLERWKDDMKIYHDAERAAYNHFKESLLAYLALTDHPKADKLFNMAWERGHGEGLRRVAEEADELSELLA